MSMRRGIDPSLSSRRAPLAAGHVGGHAGLVQEDKAACVHEALPHPKTAALLGYVRIIRLQWAHAADVWGPPCIAHQ